MQSLVVALILLLVSACARPADPPPELAFDAPVRVVAPSFRPGWHRGAIGTVGDCVVVMIPEPPTDPVRLHTIDIADVTQFELGDSTGQRWTPIDPETLRGRYGGCLAGGG